MDKSRAYGIGRQAGHRGEFEVVPAEVKAAGLEEWFWYGVRDLRAEDRINQED